MILAKMSVSSFGLGKDKALMNTDDGLYMIDFSILEKLSPEALLLIRLAGCREPSLSMKKFYDEEFDKITDPTITEKVYPFDIVAIFWCLCE